MARDVDVEASKREMTKLSIVVEEDARQEKWTVELSKRMRMEKDIC